MMEQEQDKPRLATVQLHDRGTRTLHTVHSLMAAAFIGPRPPGLDVWIREARSSERISMRELAERYGVSIGTVHRVIHGAWQ